MSLFDDGVRDMPGIGAYRRAEKIPEKDQCTSCEGLGTVRFQHSMTGRDWRTCFSCHGTGRKRESRQ